MCVKWQQPNSSWVFVRLDAPQLSCAMCGRLCHIFQFPDVQRESPVSQVVSIASAPITGHHWIEAGSVLVAPSPQVFIDTSKMPLSLLFSRLCSSSPLSLLLETCSTPAPLWPFPGCCAAHSCLSCTGEPGTVPSTLPPHPDHSWSCWPGLDPPSLSPASNQDHMPLTFGPGCSQLSACPLSAHSAYSPSAPLWVTALKVDNIWTTSSIRPVIPAQPVNKLVKKIMFPLASSANSSWSSCPSS